MPFEGWDRLYKVKGYGNIAFRIYPRKLWEQIVTAIYDECGETVCEHYPESEEFEDTDIIHEFVNAIMVGDDIRRTVDVDDLIALPEDQTVCSCGDLGCRYVNMLRRLFGEDE